MSVQYLMDLWEPHQIASRVRDKAKCPHEKVSLVVHVSVSCLNVKMKNGGISITRNKLNGPHRQQRPSLSLSNPLYVLHQTDMTYTYEDIWSLFTEICLLCYQTSPTSPGSCLFIGRGFGSSCHVVLGLGRSNTIGEFIGKKLTVQAEALMNVVVPSVIMP